MDENDDIHFIKTMDPSKPGGIFLVLFYAIQPYENQYLKFPIRSPKKRFTRDARGFFERRLRPPQYTADEKRGYSSIISSSITFKSNPTPAFHWNNNRRKIGIAIPRQDVLTTYHNYEQDAHTVGRYFDYHINIETDSKTPIYLSPFELKGIKTDSQENNAFSSHNETMVRMKLIPGRGKIFCDDQETSRLEAFGAKKIAQKIFQLKYPDHESRVGVFTYRGDESYFKELNEFSVSDCDYYSHFKELLRSNNFSFIYSIEDKEKLKNILLSEDAVENSDVEIFPKRTAAFRMLDLFELDVLLYALIEMEILSIKDLADVLYNAAAQSKNLFYLDASRLRIESQQKLIISMLLKNLHFSQPALLELLDIAIKSNLYSSFEEIMGLLNITEITITAKQVDHWIRLAIAADNYVIFDKLYTLFCSQHPDAFISLGKVIKSNFIHFIDERDNPKNFALKMKHLKVLDSSCTDELNLLQDLNQRLIPALDVKSLFQGQQVFLSLNPLQRSFSTITSVNGNFIYSMYDDASIETASLLEDNFKIKLYATVSKLQQLASKGFIDIIIDLFRNYPALNNANNYSQICVWLVKYMATKYRHQQANEAENILIKAKNNQSLYAYLISELIEAAILELNSSLLLVLFQHGHQLTVINRINSKLKCFSSNLSVSDFIDNEKDDSIRASIIRNELLLLIDSKKMSYELLSLYVFIIIHFNPSFLKKSPIAKNPALLEIFIFQMSRDGKYDEVEKYLQCFDQINEEERKSLYIFYTQTISFERYSFLHFSLMLLCARLSRSTAGMALSKIKSVFFSNFCLSMTELDGLFDLLGSETFSDEDKCEIISYIFDSNCEELYIDYLIKKYTLTDALIIKLDFLKESLNFTGLSQAFFTSLIKKLLTYLFIQPEDSIINFLSKLLLKNYCLFDYYLTDENVFLRIDHYLEKKGLRECLKLIKESEQQYIHLRVTSLIKIDHIKNKEFQLIDDHSSKMINDLCNDCFISDPLQKLILRSFLIKYRDIISSDKCPQIFRMIYEYFPELKSDFNSINPVLYFSENSRNNEATKPSTEEIFQHMRLNDY